MYGGVLLEQDKTVCRQSQTITGTDAVFTRAIALHVYFSVNARHAADQFVCIALCRMPSRILCVRASQGFPCEGG